MSESLLACATVLVADDHEPNLVLMQRILGGAGVADVHVTTDPRDAVRLFEAVRPDIVLLDLHMPGIDGVGVMEAIRQATESGNFVPVVVLTADGTSEARDRVLDAGADDFLTKPIDRTEVVLRVRNLLHTRALHEQLRLHNVELRAEVEASRAEADRAAALVDEQRHRVQQVLDAGGPRMAYQPIVELRTGRVLGHEALSRFDQEPVRPPDVWYAEAAGVGLGPDLELAAVRAALHEVPSGAMVAVNVSPEVAVSSRFADLLATSPAEDVVVEITEHVRVEDYDALTAALAELRGPGVRLAIDDAGAGWASLNHILRLDPDIIKLDISLVRGIDRDPVKRALASSLVTFAREIGAQIMAEGIETADECRCLVDLDVPWGQGYHLGRPGPFVRGSD